jgi:RNA polymerase sigma-70 factor (ECF subfamily)
MTADAITAPTLGAIPAAELRTAFGSLGKKTALADFECHVLEYRADLYRFAFWFTRDRFLAEDAVQEALLRAWQSWHALRDRSRVKHWFLTIVRRECARMYQRKRHPTSDIDDLSAAEQYLISVEDDTAVRDVQRAILSLDDTYREPLILQVLMGHTTEEIAQIIGIQRGAVLTRLCRARQKLAERIRSV